MTSTLRTKIGGLILGSVLLYAQFSNGASQNEHQVQIFLNEGSNGLSEVISELAEQTLSATDRKEIALENQVFKAQGLPVQVLQPNLSFKTAQLKLMPAPTRIQLELLLSQIQLSIQHIHLKGRVERTVGFISIGIDVEAQCRNIQVQWNENLRVASQLAVGLDADRHLKLSVDELTVESVGVNRSQAQSVDAGLSPTVRMTCEGLIGFEDEVRAELIAQIRDLYRSESGRAKIRADIQRELDKILRGEIDASLFSDSLKGIRVGLGPLSVSAANPRQLELNLCVSTPANREASENLPQGNKQSTSCPSPAHQANASSPRLSTAVFQLNSPRFPHVQGARVPLPVLELLATRTIGRGQSLFVPSNEISGFHKLMRSRLKQFFAWPDLMAFPKHTGFQWALQLNTNLERQIEVSCSSQNQLDVKTYGHAWLMQPIDSASLQPNFARHSDQILGQQRFTDVVRFDAWVHLRWKRGTGQNVLRLLPLSVDYEFSAREKSRRRVNSDIALDLIVPEVENEVQSEIERLIADQMQLTSCDL